MSDSGINLLCEVRPQNSGKQWQKMPSDQAENKIIKTVFQDIFRNKPYFSVILFVL